MKRKLGLLPTPNANVMRSSRGAMVEKAQWSAPGLEQIAELVSGELPREFETPDEIPGRSRRLLPTPAARDDKGPNPNKRDGGPDLPMAVGKLLPTPTRAGGGEGGTDFARADREGSGGDDLNTAMVKMALMPTPQASDGTGGRSEMAAAKNNWKRPSGAKASKPLGTAVRLLPTPTTSDGIGSRRSTARTPEWTSNEGTTLTDAALESSGESTAPLSSGGKSSSGGLRLSPSFVEWLMGAPSGWTDPACPLSATEFSYRQDGFADDES